MNAKVPNLLTLIRIILGIVVFFLLLNESLVSRIIAAVLFITAVITDRLDGLIARKYSLVTRFGKLADPIADKILNLGAFTALAMLGMFSYLWLIPLYFREVIVTIWRLFVKTRRDHAAKTPGKIKTIIQFITISLSFLNLILIKHIGIDLISLNVLMYLLLSLTIILTLYSGWIALKR